ncbi:MAG: glycosyltransferase family 39 protein, partial [Deltaproteobacteria bacterium]
MLNFSIQKERIYALCLIAILIFSAFLYFYRLGNESLTTDEYFSLHVARQPLNAIIFGHEKTSNPNTIPPLYEIIMHFWLNVFGASEFAQRSLSAVFGIMSVYMLYRLARLLLDTQTGLLA